MGNDPSGISGLRLPNFQPEMQRRLETSIRDVLELPRHEMRLYKHQLRQFLLEPIKAYQFKDESLEDQSRIVKCKHDERITALFALFDVPDILDRETQWEWLAMALAGELFRGCRTLPRGRGGAKPETKGRRAELKDKLFREFHSYRQEQPRRSASEAARNFLKKHAARCAEAGLREAKSFTQALKVWRENIGSSTAT